MLQWFSKKIHNRKGFTLIELVVVIAILGILAAIAVPRFANVQNNAQTQANVATARVIASAVTMAAAGEAVAGTQPDATDINQFLNDITVAVATDGTNPAAGWGVVFADATTSEFSVSLDGTTIYNP